MILQPSTNPTEDVGQIITDCQMNVGDKTKFRNAMKQLLSGASILSSGTVFPLSLFLSFRTVLQG